MDRRRTSRYLSTIAIVLAIRDAGSLAAGGKPDGSGVRKILKRLQSLYFPDLQQAEERSALDAKKILEREFKKGPLKIQALNYGGKKRKRKKR